MCFLTAAFSFANPEIQIAKAENIFANPENRFAKPENKFTNPENRFAKPENRFANPENQCMTLRIQKQFLSCASCASDA